jgi:prevent-host-death family protein
VLVRVGVKEFRENLADWLDRVEAGEVVVLVTDRGKPKARIVRADAQANLARLAAEGRVDLPTRPKRRQLPPPIPVDGSPVTDIILEHRGRSGDVL